ncbi:potassium channel protein [Rossellomorea aquimaris]|nr:potassium channel protein [Rossellomorea aquimaris]
MKEWKVVLSALHNVLNKYRHLRNSLIAINSIVLLATIAFMIFEDLPFFQSLWLTVITVLTVGYGDVVPLTKEGKVFAMVMIPIAIGIVSYGVGAIASVMLEGELSRAMKEKRMKKKIKGLSDHIIVCGLGRVGSQVLEQLKHRNIPAVYIDNDFDVIETHRLHNQYYLIGDATEDSVLLDAGIEKASGLVITLPNDAENVFTTLTAAELNPGLHIVARAEKVESINKLQKAGASKVINPSLIGGKQMVMSIVKPLSVEYVDMMFQTQKKDYGFEEISLPDRSPFANQSIAENDIRKRYGVTIVAILREEGLISNPNPSEKLKPHDKIIMFGSEEELSRFETALNG